MSEELTPIDGDSEALLAELWSTPVGRRWLLKAGLGSAAAAAVGARGWVPPAVARAAAPVSAASTTVRLQFALGAAKGVSDLVLVADGVRHPLIVHTEASRAALRAEGGLWGKLRLSALTHQAAGVQLPAERGMVISVYGNRGDREVLVSQLWHCPPDATLALAKVTHRLKGSLKGVVGSSARLASLGLSAAAVSSPQEAVQLSTILDTYTAAESLVKFHPNIATIDKTSLAVTQAVLAQTPAVTTLGNYIDKMQRQGRSYANSIIATDNDGQPTVIKLGDTTYNFKTIELNREDQTFIAAHRAALSGGIHGVRDKPELGAVIDKPLDQQEEAVQKKTWIQPQGVTPRSTAYSPARAAGGGLDIKVKNPGNVFGTTTEVNGSYQNGKVALKVSNDYVRWASVYVQYLGKGDTIVPATTGGKFPNPNPQSPDTQYAQFLGLLPQVFTIEGIPAGANTNTIDVKLSFPEGAHTARLLYCGLGSDINGGWRQYFPDDAYPGGIAPTAEVLYPSLMTGILTIGLNAFALAVEIDVAAVWGTIRKGIIEGVADKAALKELFALAKTAVNLTKGEALATALAGGAATAEEISSNGGVTNLWTILLGLGTVIIKVIFAPRTIVQVLGSAAPVILANATATKLLAALPMVGMVLAAVEALGDLATLAEVCAETVICPWVIENEVTLTYQATVTISHDQRLGPDAPFPATARSWRLEAKVDGALVLDPITGKINEGGKLQSAPVVVDVVAPFGGKQIQWSVVFLDAAGNQVGTGVSAQFSNDDPNNVPSKVAFAITQLPATITAATVFKRAATTAYSTADHGFTWSDRVTVLGTATSAGHQEVTGTAVATALGVAGMMFKQGDRYYLRGVPVAQNGKTIELASARKEGYTRRPFLLFDAFVDKGDAANHVLLEPDETTAAYDVRKLSVDPKNGKLDWDPGASYGRFVLPVSAAALHSSGRVVALHTDSGRVGRLEPLTAPIRLAGNGPETTRLATYTAGPGTQVGLLNSPVALAVTNPGTVLILEAGGPQLSAFDLNNNPVRYFGKDPDRKYTLALTSGRTYLDVAVDGASQIYLLSHTGDGSHPQDYYLDVYTATGEPLVTKSTGVNIPHLAVDYWRSFYGANYDPLTDLGTSKAHVDPALGVSEPSLSRFDPTTNTTTSTRPRAPRFTG